MAGVFYLECKAVPDGEFTFPCILLPQLRTVNGKESFSGIFPGIYVAYLATDCSGAGFCVAILFEDFVTVGNKT